MKRLITVALLLTLAGTAFAGPPAGVWAVPHRNSVISWGHGLIHAGGPTLNWSAILADEATYEILLQDEGTGTPTVTRTTTQYGYDQVSDTWKEFDAGEAVFTGRKVENVWSDSENPAIRLNSGTGTWTATGIDDPLGGTTANTLTAVGTGFANRLGIQYNVFSVGDKTINSVWLRRRIGTGAIRIYNTNNTWVGVYPDGVWRRYSIETVAIATSLYQNINVTVEDDAVDVAFLQTEIANGALTIPGEYVKTEATVEHKVFSTTNGNTVSSNIVTEGTGTELSTWAMVVEPARTNEQINSRNYSQQEILMNGVAGTFVVGETVTQATSLATGVITELSATDTIRVDQVTGTFAGTDTITGGTSAATGAGSTYTAMWTHSNVSIAVDQTGIDGSANGATVITATAANGTVIGNIITAASATHASKWFIKRSVGTGDIDLTVDGGTTWQTVTLTASYQEFNIEQALVTDPQLGIRIVTSGDAVIVGNAEAHLNKTIPELREGSPIFTTTSAVTTGAQTTAFTTADFPTTNGSFYLELYPSFSSTESGFTPDIIDAGSTGLSMASSDSFTLTDGTNTLTVYHAFSKGELIQIGGYWDADEGKMQLNLGGQWRTPKVDFDGTMDASQFQVLNNVGANMMIRNMRIWKGN